MRRALSLSEFAARLQVSARAVWQLFLVFPRFLHGEFEHGPFLLLNPATQDRVVTILDLKRKGWSEAEVRSWLERTVDLSMPMPEHASAPSGVRGTAPSSTGRPGTVQSNQVNTASEPALKSAAPVSSRRASVQPPVPGAGLAEENLRGSVEEELLVWKRLVDLAIQPFLGRIDALARDVRTLRRNG
ncbi:MAG TPA: hypothetical protein PKO06_13815 [Candidatus Ozemobacteraceae bacterium]|nr:hypothetical protein [Candidatus Ozemobacteraceae bacterium]